MNTEWSLSRGKAIFNFSMRYYTNYDQLLESEAFRSLLERYLKKIEAAPHSNAAEILDRFFPQMELDQRIAAIRRFVRLLCSMDLKEISESLPEYADAYENRVALRSAAEDFYTYWRRLERYCVLFEDRAGNGLASSYFLTAKSRFDELCLAFYRQVTRNISLTDPFVYRQVHAGTNVGMICGPVVWPIPREYAKLSGIAFIKTLILETPFITYPRKTTRSGVFREVDANPLERIGINPDHFFCMPIWVGNLLAYVYVHRDFLTHGIALANLFEIANEREIAGRKPDLVYIMGGENHREEGEDIFHYDRRNDIMVGFVSKHEEYDYFGYMKKMVLTLHNVRQIHRGNLPIHGAFVTVTLKSGKSANVCIMGDSGAGKSESIEAFRKLAADYISDMTVVFDDMGTFVLQDNGSIQAYGTEIGAFVRLDDLDSGYAFKELDRSIFMNPDKVNARLIVPVSSYEEISRGHSVDLFLYANNYEAVDDRHPSVQLFQSKEEAIPTFLEGKRMTKGTTSEVGLTTSYFANPFGPVQKQEKMKPLIDKYFDVLFTSGVRVGVLRTQLGIAGHESSGPEEAAKELFRLIQVEG